MSTDMYKYYFTNNKTLRAKITLTKEMEDNNTIKPALINVCICRKNGYILA